MPRYINAEHFEESLDLMCDAGGVLAPVTEAVREMVKELIKAEPTADVQEVKHGRWIESDFLGLYGIYYRCSVCDLKDEVPTNEGEPLYYYCPWCGAKMDESERISAEAEEDRIVAAGIGQAFNPD